MTVWIQNPFDSLPHEGYRKQRYWLMAEAFAAAGHKVTYFTSDFSHARKARRELRMVESKGIEVVAIATRPYQRNISVGRILSHVAYAREWERMAVGRPNLIITSMPSISAAGTAIRLGRRFGARVVVDVQDAWPQTFERLVPRWARSLAKLALFPLRIQARRIFSAADRVTGTCERYRKLVARADYYKAYLGAEFTGECNKAETERKDEYAGAKLRLVYVGNLGRSYDLETVQRVVAENEELTLDVAGFGEFHPCCERVRFHGMLSATELTALLGQCDVGVVPMQGDSEVGLPNKVFDYVAAGLRVVSSLGGELDEVLTRNSCGANYRAGDAQSLLTAARAAGKLPRENALRLAKGEFNAQNIYRDYAMEVTRS